MKHTLIIALVLFVVACKSPKEDATLPTPSTPTPNAVATAPLNFHLHPYIGENEVDAYNIVYHTTDGRKMSLSMAQVFLSEIELVKFDGSIYAVKDTVLLAHIAQQVYSLGNVPVGNYRTIRFKAGIVPAVNAKVPSGTSGPLNNQSMWFSTPAQANNYVFMNCSGKIDTTKAKTSTDAEMVSFTYKIGANPQLKQIIMPNQTFAVQPNATTYVHMLADYSVLFNGVDLKNYNNMNITTSEQNAWPDNGQAWPIAVTVADNIVNLFRYENE